MFNSKYIKKILKYSNLFRVSAFMYFLPNIIIQAQDIHFSQFYTTPVLTNPASTGMSGESLRIANNYRNQWAKIGIPYQTLCSSFDKKVSISGQSFGIGGLIIHDQSSAYNLSADEFLISLSYSKIINNHQFAVGIQSGFVYKSFNSDELTFGSQFDPSFQQFNSDLPSFENGLNENLYYFDMNVGIFWRTLIMNIMPSAGFSISHVFRPVVTFSSSSESLRLPMKLTFNSQVNIPLSNKLDITPSLLYSSVPGANEFLFGGTEGYTINDFFIPVKRINAITMFRLNPFRNIDAMILGGGVRFSKFDLGITYDFNISPLSKASSFNGAFEISLIFTGGGSTKKNVNEPCYIY